MLSTLSLSCCAGIAAVVHGQAINRRLSHPTSLRVKVATKCNQNSRKYMEDFTQSTDWSDDKQHPLYRCGFRLLAVFDGHGHHQTAQLLSTHVKRYVGDAALSIVAENSFKAGRTHQELTPEQVERLLSDAFFAMDQKLRQISAEANWKHGGAAAVVVMINDTHIVSANVGDSRALLWAMDASKCYTCPQSIAQSIVPLSKDHKPDEDEERRRIELVDGFSVASKGDGNEHVSRVWPKGYKKPNLNLSRAFGDFHCKPYSDKPSENPVSVEPFLQTMPLSQVGRAGWKRETQRSFLLVLASDGVVNDNFCNEELVSCAQDFIQSVWNTHVAPGSCSRTNPCGTDFLQRMPDSDWAGVASSLLSRTKRSNGGDNQSIHLVALKQTFERQLCCPALASSVSA